MRQELLNGQYWPRGLFPLGRARIDWADGVLRAIAAKYGGGTVWADVRDLAGTSSGATVQTLPSRIGADFAQAAAGQRPVFQAHGFPDGGPALDFNGATMNMVSAADMSASSKATVFVSFHHPAQVNVFEVLVEYGTYFAGPGNGWTIMGSTAGAVDRVYTGIGVNPTYSDHDYNNQSTGTKVLSATYDTALAKGSEMQFSANGVYVAPTSTGVGAGAAGNWVANGNISIGARINAGTPERFYDGLIREVFVVPDVVTQNDTFAISQALCVKAGIQ
jgi:hypothetical protein